MCTAKQQDTSLPTLQNPQVNRSLESYVIIGQAAKPANSHARSLTKLLHPLAASPTYPPVTASPFSSIGPFIRIRTTDHTAMSSESSKKGSIPSMETSGDALTEETVVVVLGASGDLAQKKTFPALFALFTQGFLPKDIHIVGYARTSECLLPCRRGRGRGSPSRG